MGIILCTGILIVITFSSKVTGININPSLELIFYYLIPCSGIFAVMKIFGLFNGSWLWVLSPIWLMIDVLGLGALAVTLILYFKGVKRNE